MHMLSVSAVLIACAAPVQGQSDAITRDAIVRAVASIASRVETNYVVPDTGRLIADYLRSQLAAGAYANYGRAPSSPIASPRT